MFKLLVNTKRTSPTVTTLQVTLCKTLLASTVLKVSVTFGEDLLRPVFHLLPTALCRLSNLLKDQGAGTLHAKADFPQVFLCHSFFPTYHFFALNTGCKRHLASEIKVLICPEKHVSTLAVREDIRDLVSLYQLVPLY